MKGNAPASVRAATAAAPVVKVAPTAKKSASAGSQSPLVPLAIFGIVLMLVLGFISFQFADDEVKPSGDTKNPFSSSGAGAEFTPDQNPAAVGELRNETGVEPEQKRLSYYGLGAGKAGPFTVSGGILKVDANYDGRDGYFALKIVNSTTLETVESLLSRDWGRFSGTHYVAVPQGTYLVDVETAGDKATWSVGISFPSLDSGMDGDGKLAGSGYGAAQPIYLTAGDHKIRYQFADGGQYFTTEIFDWKGERLADSCGAFGPVNDATYDRVRTCVIPADGPYFVNVESHTDWIITF